MVFFAIQAREISRLFRSNERSSEMSDSILRISLLLLPIITFLPAALLHGPVISRYVIVTILGIVLTFGSFRSAPKGANVVVVSFLVIHAAIGEAIFWNSVHSQLASRPTAPVESLIERAGHAELPVVVGHGLVFLPLEKYASPQVRSRLVYPVDAAKAIQYSGTDSIDENLVRLRRYAPIAAPDFSEFARDHSAFLLYTRKLEPDLDWLTPYLAKSASSVELLAQDNSGRVVLVKM